MATDIVYYFEKKSPYRRRLFGDVQIGDKGLNQSFVIDGTKDSCKMVVHSYNGKALEPYTICFHNNTNTWWIVSNDKVSRYQNESGFYYVHELSLLGAIELLNARDLTDCGFNNDRYTFGQFINRLFALSTFEFATNITYGSVNSSQTVEFLKTFENYSLLSALREFLDSYNLSAVLTFTTTGPHDNIRLNEANLEIFSKSGSNTFYDMDYFDEVEETKTINKNSFGTSVVSNAENVVSTSIKRFPTIGGVKVSADSYYIDSYNALLRLPSNVAEVKSITMINTKCRLTLSGLQTLPNWTYSPEDINTINWAYNSAIDYVNDLGDTDLYNDLVNNRNINIIKMQKSGQVKFNNISKYDPINNSFSEFPIHCFNGKQGQRINYVLGNQTLRNGILSPEQVMYWQKGNDTIKGFDFFSWNHSASTLGTDNQTIRYVGYYNGTNSFVNVPDSEELGSSQSHGLYIQNYLNMGSGASDLGCCIFELRYTIFKVDYVPMSDLKIKYDNSSIGNDMQLYNQNGKLNDSSSLSKLLLSYSKEIENQTITKYKTFYDYDDVPLVGSCVLDSNGNKYVINNISLDIYMNEKDNNDIGYYIVGEFTMSLYTATKSLLTNPSSNIRDYGIPQNNNVKRKQVYRDFYEFAYSADSNADTDWYLPLSKILPIDIIPDLYQEHIAIMKLTLANNENWYYQLDTTTYMLKKSIYEIVDFKDNNIIGYDMQNSSSGFDITRILSGDYTFVNTPISYVDSSGEVKNIKLNLCTAEQMYDNYNNSAEANHCFISQQTFDNSENNNDISINETNYNKDALEVPVFEYSTQLDDTPNVQVGEEILTQEYDDYMYIYCHAFVPKNIANENNYYQYVPSIDIDENNNVIVDDAVQFGLFTDDNELYIYFYNSTSINYYTRVGNWDDDKDISSYLQDYDCLIFRIPIKNDSSIGKTKLMFILKNLNTNVGGYGQLKLFINHYKIK